jgi:hypothetical protein
MLTEGECFVIDNTLTGWSEVISEGDADMKKMAVVRSKISPMVNPARASKSTESIGHTWSRNTMKSLLAGIGLTAVFLASSSSQAALVTYDGFHYTASGPLTLDGQPSNGTQASNGWDDVTWGQFLGGATSYVITNGSLMDPSGLLYAYSNSVYTTGGFAGRFFTTPANWGVPGSPYYFSILVRPTNTPATNQYYGLQIFSNNADTGDGHDLFVGKNGSGLNWGLEYSTNSISGSTTNTVYVDAYSSVAAAANQTVLLVVRVDFNFDAPDVFKLYVNPTPGGSEPVTPDATLTNDIGTQNGLALNAGNGGTAFFDEVRLGATFASVTPTTGAADPNLLTYEPFAYNQGSGPASLHGQPSDGTQGSNGWDNVWWGQIFGGGTDYIIANGSLSDPSHLLVTTGNCTSATADNYADRFNVYTGLPGNTNVSPTYYSILIRPDNAPTTTNYYGLELYTSLGNGNVFVGKNGAGLNWGLQQNSNQVFSSVACTISQTVFLVVRGEYTSSSSNTFRLYVNPTPGAPEPGTADAIITANLGTQNGLNLTTGNGGLATFDELRIGTNYADVTPAVAVVTNTNKFNITSIARVGNDIVLTWNTTGGNTNAVQATNGSNGNYSTNNFADISGQIIITGSGSVTTNYVDSSGATNSPSRYYRVRRVP